MLKFLFGVILACVLGVPKACDAKTTKMYTPEAAAAIKRTATVVFTPEGAEDSMVIGSAWAVKSGGDYKMVTAQHVALAVQDAPGDLLVCSYKWDCTVVDVQAGAGPVLGESLELDWIYWEVDKLPRGMKASKLGDRPVIGEPVCVTGAPLGRVGEYTCGGVTNDLGALFYVDARVLPGNSGGPVFDADGRVIGMIIAIDLLGGMVPVEGSALAIPVSQLWL